MSTNGSNGPSIGIAHEGAAPTIRSGVTITPGQGGPFIDVRSYTDTLGNTRTVPATPAGLSKEVLAL